MVYTTASRAVLFIYMAPFVVTIGAHWLIPGERLRAAKIAGLVCAFSGLGIAFADALRLPTRRELVGDAMVLAGAVFWGATTLVIKARRRQIGPSRTLFYQLAGSAMILLALSFLFREPGFTDPRAIVIAALGYQTIVIAFASYLAWFWLLARYPAAELSAFSFWTPIFGVVASGLILHEPISPALVISVALVAGGIYLVNRAGD